jgi:hypothetical protein
LFSAWYDHAGDKALSSGKDTPKPLLKRSAAPVGTTDRDMGAALRTVYQETVEETVPDEFLDLLGKLD